MSVVASFSLTEEGQINVTFACSTFIRSGQGTAFACQAACPGGGRPLRGDYLESRTLR